MVHAYALPDTIVVDDPDELTMQVHVDGCFHRRIPTLSHTACGQPIHSQFAATRREELCEPLCRGGCFTSFELRLTDERAAKENG